MIAVTGINGFIGSSLYKYFYNKFLNVFGISTHPQRDNVIELVDGVPQNKIKGLKSVIHCGGLVGNGFKKADYIYANVECTRNLLNWCEKQHVEHFLFFSTGAVYGSQKNWVDEKAGINPNSSYAESKLFAETLVRQSTIPIKTIIRLYFPIGGIKDKHLFSRITQSIKTGKVVFINNKQGHPLISPIDLYDVCRISELIILNKLSGTYNLSSNFEISFGEVINQIASYYCVNPFIDVKGIGEEAYLGNSNKLIKATGYEKFINPKFAINRLLIGDNEVENKKLEN